MAVARLAIAAGAAFLLIAIVISLLSWHGFVSGEIWALFASFVLAIGVLLLYEIRDILLQRSATWPGEKSQAAAPGIIAPSHDMAGGVLRSIGALGSLVWLPLQPAEDRMVIRHLSMVEQRELQNRLGILTLCMAGTTIAPVFVAFILISPVAVCIAATMVASNLFVLDWFKKRHKKWLYSTEYAKRQGIKPASG
ncbi:MAG TPA: hypothetical protein VG125_12870 [Pirellulales bacterium]|nr:hypothetical protein [Pirellulales bacterium]